MEVMRTSRLQEILMIYWRGSYQEAWYLNMISSIPTRLGANGNEKILATPF